jgi:hypothetical protein
LLLSAGVRTLFVRIQRDLKDQFSANTQDVCDERPGV